MNLRCLHRTTRNPSISSVSPPFFSNIRTIYSDTHSNSKPYKKFEMASRRLTRPSDPNEDRCEDFNAGHASGSRFNRRMGEDDSVYPFKSTKKSEDDSVSTFKNVKKSEADSIFTFGHTKPDRIKPMTRSSIPPKLRGYANTDRVSGLKYVVQELQEVRPQRFRPWAHRNRKAPEYKTHEVREGRSVRSEPTRRGLATFDSNGISGLRDVRASQDGPSQRERSIKSRSREASGYKTQQQMRASDRDQTQDVWSVENEPNIRVDATQTQVLHARDRVKGKVQFAVQRMFGFKYRVEYFGSTRYGVSHSHSDLDMIIVDPDHPQGFVKKDITDPIYNARTLALAMRRCGFRDVDFLARATVPIVQFKDRVSGLDCDLNTNERLGLINSDMIREYCDNSNVLRPMLFSIKEWAKPLLLNSPSGSEGQSASFSSYALALMTIAFLQSEGLLPNLQANLPPLSSDERKQTLVWSRKPQRGWDARFRKLENYAPPEEPDVESLLLKWFQFWSTFPYEQKCASIRHGGFLDRNSSLLTGFHDSASSVCVIDPFITSKNTTVAIARKVLLHFKTECLKAAADVQE